MSDEEEVECLKQKIEALEKKNKKLNKTVAMLTKDENDEDMLNLEEVDIKIMYKQMRIAKVQKLED